MSWLLTDSGDIDFTGNQMRLTSDPSISSPGAQEAKQNLAQNLRILFGEWFLDETLGIPYFQVLFEKGATVETVKAYIQAAALATKGITSVESIDVTLNAQTRGGLVTLACTYNNSEPVSVAVTI